MECEENGGGVFPAEGRRGVKRKRRGGGARLAGAPPARRAAAPPPDLALVPPASAFLSNMEDIAFWVYTKQAPCLYNYENIYKKRINEAHGSKPISPSKSPSVTEVPSPKKKRKKLRLLDEESASSERQQNVYFETSQKQNQKSQTTLSESDGSDVDFNIKNTSYKNKSKGTKLQKNKRATHHKKNKIVTSTPKVTGLRRSLRKAQQNLNNNSQLDCSYEILNASAINGGLKPDDVPVLEGIEKSGDRDQASNIKNATVTEKINNEIVANGQYEDLSDVSGFTANYIRSTKLNSKTPRKVRSKASRNLVREAQQRLQKDESKIIVCVNQSANTEQPNAALNCSTDSSHVMNLMTVKNNGKAIEMDKSTSALRFMDLPDLNKNTDEKKIKKTLNLSYKSNNSGISRYPTRHKNNSRNAAQDLASNNNRNSSARKKRGSRVMAELNNVDGNDNPSASVTPKTRNGKRKVHLQNDTQETQQRLNNSTDQMSSSVTLNVAGPENSGAKKKRNASKGVASASKPADKRQRLKRDSVSDSTKKKGPGGSVSSSSPAKCINRVNKTVTKTRQSLKKDSLRDKSGFAACFSDSDNDSEPLIRRKFFC